ncbi:MAG: hypothetical protein V4685_06145 [Bacteroidota bacterium]
MKEKLERSNFIKLTFHEDGFVVELDKGLRKIKWNEIEELVVYKEDLMTFDEIRMDIVYNGLQITITEDNPEWDFFVSKAKSVFPSIPAEWESQIIQPPFAENRRIIYERDKSIL